MPLHLQYSGQGKSPDGKTVAIPAARILRVKGPAVMVSVGISKELEDKLVATGQPVPAPVTGPALVDTGASGCCVDETIAQKLGVAPIDVVNISSASHAASQKPVFPVRLTLMGTNLTVNASRAIGVPLQPQGFIALLGRDFLQRFVLIYNGPAGELTLAS
jgi:predicted aspartyl protease